MTLSSILQRDPLTRVVFLFVVRKDTQTGLSLWVAAAQVSGHFEKPVKKCGHAYHGSGCCSTVAGADWLVVLEKGRVREVSSDSCS